jgi:PAS domain S-box-containing protein
MAKNSGKLSNNSAKLNQENAALRQKLRESKATINAIKKGNIDAVVFSDKKALTIYTEKTSDKTYRILIEKMNEGAVTLNEEGTILYCNSYFANMVNLPLQKVIGTKFKNFNDNSSKKSFDALLKQGRKKAVKEEVVLYPANSKAIPVLMSVNPLSLDNSFALSIILTDLTIQNKNQEELKHRKKQLEQKNIELENANKDLTSFTYVSSHDLQEPLRKIQNYVTCILLEEEKNLSETGKEYFRRMRQAAERMQALIEDLLVYSRTKSTDRKFEKTDLNIIVGEVKKDFEDVIQEKKATVDVANLCEVNIIRFQFRQLMHNLISNSLKFSKPATAPDIIIKSKIVRGSTVNNEKLLSKQNYCHISYADNGIGFDPQYKDRIFQVFQRLHSKEEYQGTGMGLAICKRVVENHNGIITATGELNKGARFDIYIPAS